MHRIGSQVCFAGAAVESVATYSRHGHDEAARDVLLAKHRRHRASQLPALRLRGYVQDWTVGYGYRPGRAAGWPAVLVLVATVALGRSGRRGGSSGWRPG